MDGDQKLDLKTIKKVHFTGIKGVGMTALACIGKDLDWEISGSDTTEKFVTDSVLEKKGIKWSFGFDGDKIDQNKPGLVIYTAAHEGINNPEVKRAQKLDIPFMSQGEALGHISQSKRYKISIAGVGGKTTTTAMLATILENSGLQPSYMLGAGDIKSLDFCGKYDPKGDIFVTEADEYPCSLTDKKPKFYYQNPNIIIITNLAYDHPDVYQNEKETLAVFTNFINKLSDDGLLIINADSPLLRVLTKNFPQQIISYGYMDNCDVIISDIAYKNGKTGFNLTYNYANRAFAVKLAGKMNVSNTAAAIIASRKLGLSDYQIQKGLNTFRGVARRMEIIARYKTTLLMDDYAHHPDEIKATLATLATIYPKKKVIAIFQPHTYSRTKALFHEFASSFNNCQTVLIADIYASAREKSDNEINSELLTKEINMFNQNGVYVKNFGGFLEFMENKNLANTIIITMGAGDIFSWHEGIIQKIKRSYNKWI